MMKKANRIAVIFGAALCLGLPSTSMGQNLADWKVDAPPDTVQLVSVKPTEPATLESVTFTFKNISSKTILAFSVFLLDENGTDIGGTGLRSFYKENKPIDPGAPLIAIFSKRNLPSGNQSVHGLRFEAIVYTDGTQVGSRLWLEEIENEILGAALETKRDADFLATSTDPSVAGLDAVLVKVGTFPETGKEAAIELRGIELPGIPSAFIDARLKNPEYGLVQGIRGVRSTLLREIARKKAIAKLSQADSKVPQSLIDQAQSYGLSDIANEYRIQSETLTEYAHAFMVAGD